MPRGHPPLDEDVVLVVALALELVLLGDTIAPLSREPREWDSTLAKRV